MTRRFQLLLGAVALLMLAAPALARERITVYCSQGNTLVVTQGVSSTTQVVGSFPSCTVSVFATGTTNLISIFADNSGTVKSNPFTADSTGKGFFYADNQRVDVQFSNGGIPTPFTVADILLNDPTIQSGNFIASTFSSASTPVATTGVFDLASSDIGLCWRNNANSADLCFTKNSSDVLNWPSGMTISGNLGLSTNRLTAGGFTSANSNPALTGTNRFSSNDTFKIRNNANSGDLNLLSKNAADVLAIGDTAGISTTGPINAGSSAITGGTISATGITDSGNATISGNVSAASYNSARVMGDTMASGPDIGVQLANCLAALPSAGGVCDFSNVHGGTAASTFNMNKSGVEIILGPGAWVFSGSPGINWTAHGSSLHSSTTQDAVFLYTSSATADLLAVAGGASGGLNYFAGFSTAATVARSAGAAIRVTTASNVFERITLYPTFDGMVFGAGGGGNTIDRFNINGLGGSGAAWRCVITTGGVASGTVSGNLFHRYTGSSNGPGATDATFCIQDGSDTMWFTDGESVANVGGNDTVQVHIEKVNGGNDPSNIFITGADYEGGATKAAIVIDAGQNIEMTAVNAASSLRGALITGGTRIKWNGGHIFLNQQEGVRITGGLDIDVSHARFANNSQATNNTYDDVFVAANLGGFKFNSNTFKKEGAPANLPKFNAEIAAGTANFYEIKDNTMPGDNVSGAISDGGTGASKHVCNPGLTCNISNSDFFTTGNITANSAGGGKVGFGGDIALVRSATSGVIWLGSDSTVFLDRGVTKANTVTLTAAPLKVPNTLQVTGSNFTTSSGALVSVTGLTFTTPASAATNWSFRCDLIYSQATAAAANVWGIITTGTAPTNLQVAMEIFTSNAGAQVDNNALITTAAATNITTATPSAFGAIGTNADMFNAHIYGTIEAPSNASPSVVAIAVATGNGADALTIYRGSACWWY